MNGRLARKWKFDPKDQIAAFPEEKWHLFEVRFTVVPWRWIKHTKPQAADTRPDDFRWGARGREAFRATLKLTQWTCSWLMNGVHWHNWWITSFFHCTKRETIKQNPDASTLNRWHQGSRHVAHSYTRFSDEDERLCGSYFWGFFGQAAESPRLTLIESKTSQFWKLQQSLSYVEWEEREHTKGKMNRGSTFPFWVSSVKWNLSLKLVQSFWHSPETLVLHTWNKDKETHQFSTDVLDKCAVNVLHQEEIQAKWWRKALSCHLYCLPGLVMYEKVVLRMMSSQPSTLDTCHLTCSSTNTDPV